MCRSELLIFTEKQLEFLNFEHNRAYDVILKSFEMFIALMCIIIIYIIDSERVFKVNLHM